MQALKDWTVVGVPHQPKEDIGVECALMGLIHHHDRVGCQIRLAQELPQQHAIRHVLDDRLVRGAVLEADGVAHLLPQLAAHLAAQ